MFDPNTEDCGWVERAGVGPMFCGRCLAKREKIEKLGAGGAHPVQNRPG
jgi:hypothetical protein